MSVLAVADGIGRDNHLFDSAGECPQSSNGFWSFPPRPLSRRSDACAIPRAHVSDFWFRVTATFAFHELWGVQNRCQVRITVYSGFHMLKTSGDGRAFIVFRFHRVCVWRDFTSECRLTRSRGLNCGLNRFCPVSRVGRNTLILLVHPAGLEPATL